MYINNLWNFNFNRRGGGNSGGGGGGYFCVQKMENLGRRGGTCVNSLRGGGMDIFWNYTMEMGPC